MRILLRVLIALLSIGGIVTSALALRIHYQDPSQAPPCAVTEKWDCGTVNHSRYSVFPATEVGDDPAQSHSIPVALLGIIGYAVILLLVLLRWPYLVLLASLGGLLFAGYLTSLEARVLEKWCIYCVTSQTIIAAIALLAVLNVVLSRRRLPGESPAASR